MTKAEARARYDRIADAAHRAGIRVVRTLYDGGLWAPSYGGQPRHVGARTHPSTSRLALKLELARRQWARTVAEWPVYGTSPNPPVGSESWRKLAGTYEVARAAYRKHRRLERFGAWP